jgi:hypothetical protein
MTDRERLAKFATVPGLATATEHDLLMLLRFANEMAGFYQSPVYLCGSALTTVAPRDIDIRVQLDDDDFTLRYASAVCSANAVKQWLEEGHTGAWTQLRWNWSADCTKRTKHAWKLTNMNVDFQVYPETYCEMRFSSAPRLRIDEMPEPAS